MTMASQVDQNALRFNQACIIVLLLLAYLFNWPWLVALVAAVMLIGTIWPAAGLFKLLYGSVLRPAGLIKPKLVADQPQPHLFAQGVGGIFLLLSTLSFVAGLPVLAWILAGIVVVLAAVNLFLGFCAGCFMYYQLGRLGVKPSLPTWHTAQQGAARK
jgi:hypothetical protein